MQANRRATLHAAPSTLGGSACLGKAFEQSRVIRLEMAVAPAQPLRCCCCCTAVRGRPFARRVRRQLLCYRAGRAALSVTRWHRRCCHLRVDERARGAAGRGICEPALGAKHGVSWQAARGKGPGLRACQPPRGSQCLPASAARAACRCATCISQVSQPSDARAARRAWRAAAAAAATAAPAARGILVSRGGV